MDVGRFTDVAEVLLDRLDGRLTATDRDTLRGYLWGGEWGLLADELAAALTEDHTPIDATERDLLQELLYSLELDENDEDAAHYPALYARDTVMRSLNVVGM
jgi:hypothetical protein